MAYTTIDKSTNYFDTRLYTGTGAENVVSDLGFNPDFVWFKKRSATEHHFLYDQVRGALKKIASSNQNAEATETQTLKSFGSGGYTLGTSAEVNGSSVTYVAWNWKANGQGSSNTDGSINTTYTSANTTTGISISKYTGTGANATVGHGLGVAPKMIIFKNLDTATAWDVFFHDVGQGRRLFLDQSVSFNTSTNYMNDTYPTSTVFSVGNADNTNKSGSPMIAYCFTDVTGYQKIGSWSGNGNADGVFIYTGFKPAFILSKNSNRNENWLIHDNKRSTYNVNQTKLSPNDTSVDSTNSAFALDFLSNGFKIRTTDTALNQSGELYAYLAIAEAPLVGSNNIPATAR
tara:strand:+ start:16 stop:1053 length:1038 start_codon:yes stop_codon:yes gene_type:complete